MKKIIVIILLTLSACRHTLRSHRDIKCDVISEDRCLCCDTHNSVNSLFTESCSVMRKGGYSVRGAEQ